MKFLVWKLKTFYQIKWIFVASVKDTEKDIFKIRFAFNFETDLSNYFHLFKILIGYPLDSTS